MYSKRNDTTGTGEQLTLVLLGLDGRQTDFWRMHEYLFEHQKALQDTDLQRYASDLGLDVGRFDRDRSSPQIARGIVQVADATGLDLIAIQDHVYNHTFVDTRTLLAVQQSVATFLVFGAMALLVFADLARPQSTKGATC